MKVFIFLLALLVILSITNLTLQIIKFNKTHIIIKRPDTVDVIHGHGKEEIPPDTAFIHGLVTIKYYYNAENWKVIVKKHNAR